MPLIQYMLQYNVQWEISVPISRGPLSLIRSVVISFVLPFIITSSSASQRGFGSLSVQSIQLRKNCVSSPADLLMAGKPRVANRMFTSCCIPAVMRWQTAWSKQSLTGTQSQRDDSCHETIKIQSTHRLTPYFKYIDTHFKVNSGLMWAELPLPFKALHTHMLFDLFQLISFFSLCSFPLSWHLLGSVETAHCWLEKEGRQRLFSTWRWTPGTHEWQ